MCNGVEDLIRADRRVTIDTIATAIGCSHGMAYLIMHDSTWQQFSQMNVGKQQKNEDSNEGLSEDCNIKCICRILIMICSQTRHTMSSLVVILWQ
jgi:hypothetical protein